MGNTCIFTIVSRNYLHYARTLMAGVEQFAPGADRLVGLCDERGDFDFSEENFDLLELRELEIPQIDKFIFRYTILELNTAIKPYIISALFQRGYKKVIYFDPDIRIYRSLDGMLSLLDEHQMLLTPHLTGPLDDDLFPSELNILVSGTYNLGYIGLCNTADMRRFAHWWEGKLYTECVVDVKRGLFVDQKWVDLAPGMYEGVYINRNPGWNTAYWDLKHRRVEVDDGEYSVNGEPLVFFHFSGFSGKATTLSKHQNRYSKKSAGAAVAALCRDYAAELEDNGLEQTRQLAYHYGQFVDGTPIPDFARYIYREDYDWERSVDNPYDSQGCANFLGYLNEPVTLNGKRIPWITRLAHKLYLARQDLQEVFPDLNGPEGKRFADWYILSAAEQVGFDECFILPVRHALSQLGDSDEDAPVAKRLVIRINQALYRLAWRYRYLIRPFMAEDLRHSVHRRLVDNLAGKMAPTARSHRDLELPRGINLFGYVNAESGTGQSARSSINNILAAGIPLAVVDFRENNISRMEANIQEGVLGDPRYNINLFHINADQTVNAIAHLGHEVLRGRYNIGYWAWELAEFPDEWLPAIPLLDEIWVPSDFCRDAIAAKADIPVVTIPHSIQSPPAPVTADPASLALPEHGTRFLVMFDALSIPERKNPDGAIEAFQRAKHDANIDAHLVIKVNNLDTSPDAAETLRALVAEDDSITLIEGYLTRQEINRLIASCEVFLSLHRSEGFGLGLAEAMLMGKAVIATNWSGNLEFMCADNSLLVDYRLVTLESDFGPYKAGQQWAEPDIASASRAIIALCDDPQLADRLGEVASRRIRDSFSAQRIGELISRRLQAIGEGEADPLM